MYWHQLLRLSVWGFRLGHIGCHPCRRLNLRTGYIDWVSYSVERVTQVRKSIAAKIIFLITGRIYDFYLNYERLFEILAKGDFPP